MLDFACKSLPKQTSKRTPPGRAMQKRDKEMMIAPIQSSLWKDKSSAFPRLLFVLLISVSPGKINLFGCSCCFSERKEKRLLISPFESFPILGPAFSVSDLPVEIHFSPGRCGARLGWDGKDDFRSSSLIWMERVACRRYQSRWENRRTPAVTRMADGALNVIFWNEFDWIIYFFTSKYLHRIWIL